MSVFDVQIRTIGMGDQVLGVEWEWEGMDGFLLIGPEDGAPRLVLTITNMAAPKEERP